MRNLSSANLWLVATVLSGCPLDIEVQSADSKDEVETQDAEAETDGYSDGSADEQSGASCVEAIKRVCAAEGRDDESCVELIVAKCDPKGDYDRDEPSAEGSCGDAPRANEECKLASEKCQYLEPEQCDELLAQVCVDEPPVAPSGTDDCWSSVVTACDEWMLSEKECDALLDAKCIPPAPPTPDNGCFDQAFSRCKELMLSDVECKEWVVRVCEPASPPDASGDPITDCVKTGKDAEACKNGAGW